MTQWNAANSCERLGALIALVFLQNVSTTLQLEQCDEKKGGFLCWCPKSFSLCHLTGWKQLDSKLVSSTKLLLSFHARLINNLELKVAGIEVCSFVV